MRALVELLTSLFTTKELYRFAAFHPSGDLGADLPGGNASLQEVAFGLADALDRRGYIDDALFARLVEERSGREAEITRIRAQILDSTPPAGTTPIPATAPGIEEDPSLALAGHRARRSPDLIDFTGERGRHEHFFGRRDILCDLDEWLRSGESGWLLLTGSPGLGTSAIFHHWLGLREQAGLPTAFHFIGAVSRTGRILGSCARAWLLRSSGTSPSSATPRPIRCSGWSSCSSG